MIELTLKHFLDIGFIRLVYQCGVGKVTFPLGGFFRQDVAFESVLPFEYWLFFAYAIFSER
jgi:hypothetical protein